MLAIYEKLEVRKELYLLDTRSTCHETMYNYVKIILDGCKMDQNGSDGIHGFDYVHAFLAYNLVAPLYTKIIV